MASRYKLLRRPNQPVSQPQGQQSIATDLSLLQQPMEISLTGALQVARCLSSGTPEMRELLTEECDIIFECRVCRNLFRNLPNFIAHKRHYCQQCYLDTKVGFMEAGQDTETVIVQPEAPKDTKQCVFNGMEEACMSKTVIHRRKPAKIVTKFKDKTDSPVAAIKEKGTNLENAANGLLHTDSPKEILIEGTSAAFKFYTKASEKVMPSEDSRKRCLVELENVAGNSNAKRQWVKLDARMEDLKAASKKASGPSRSDLAVITESFDRVKEEVNDAEEEMVGSRKRNLRQRGGGGEVKTPIADKLSQRKDCDVKTQTCLKCCATYSSLKTLHFHMMSLHSEKQTVYPCAFSECKATFTQIWVAVRHLYKVHGCSKKQTEKLKAHLKKYAFTCPVDDMGDLRKNLPVDISLQTANKRKRADDHREKVDKLMGEATETITNMTKRLAEKMKKPKDVLFKFGSSGFTLYKCQNCNKTFAKHDSLSRHNAFCFGIGGLDLGKPSTARQTKPKCAKPDAHQKDLQIPNPEAKDVSEITTEPKQNGDDVVTAEEKILMTENVVVSKTVLSKDVKTEIEPLKNNNHVIVSSESEDKMSDFQEKHAEGLDSGESEAVVDSWEEEDIVKEEVDEKSLLEYISRRRHSDLDSKALDMVRSLINEEQLVCLKCSRKYGNISNLHRHALRHLGWKRFRCTLCSFTAYNRSECKTHLNRVHLEMSHKFILDLDPEDMRSGISAKSRVQSGRQSSLRILEKMQQERRMQLGNDNSLSPSKRALADTFNISTRNSPRAFDIRPYQRVEQGTMLITHSPHYAKSDMVNHKKNKQLEKFGSTYAWEPRVKEEDGMTSNECQWEQEVNGEVTSHISEDTNYTLSPPALVQQTMIIDNGEESSVTLSPPVLTEQTLITDSDSMVQDINDEDIHAPEVIYVMLDNDDVDIDPAEVITVSTDTTAMETVVVDTTAQLVASSPAHSLYSVENEPVDMVSEGDANIIANNAGIVGFVEEEVVAGDAEIMNIELKEEVLTE